MIKSKLIKRAELIGIFIILCQVFAWCLSTITYKSNVAWIGALMVEIMTVILYITLFKSSLFEKWDKELIELNVFIGIISGTLLLTSFRSDILVERVTASVFGSIWLLTVVYCSLIKKNLLKSYMLSISLKKYIFDYKWIIVLMCVLVALAFTGDTCQFKWDGLLYYEASKNLNLFSISSLAQYGHISQFYSICVKLVTLLTGNVAWAMFINNVMMMCMSVCAFYGIIKNVCPGKGDIIYVLLTAMYGFSPFLAGMVNYYSLDYCLICILPLVMYMALKKRWIAFVVASCFFCFTKETAIVIYGSMCLGILIADIFTEQGYFIKRIQNILGKVRYYYMFTIGCIWLIIYKILGPWSAGSGGFGIDFNFIIKKTKVMLILNFNWLLVLIILIGAICVLGKRFNANIYINCTLPVICMGVLFYIFSIMFATANHARYIDSGFFVIYILVALVLLGINQKMVTYIISVLLSALLLVSNYYTIDPVSNMLFERVDIGSNYMITTSNVGFGDSMIYNKQMLYMEEAIREVVSDAYLNGYDIAMPTIKGLTYYFDGMQIVRTLEEGYDKRVLFCNDKGSRFIQKKENTKGIDFYAFSENIDYSYLTENMKKPIIYIYTDSFGQKQLTDIRNKCCVIDEYVVNCKGWKINTIIFE